MKTYNAKKEYTEQYIGRGFKIMYPTEESLKDMINPNPKTKEEAQKNKELNEQIRKLNDN
jgi:hypothetical protein